MGRRPLPPLLNDTTPTNPLPGETSTMKITRFNIRRRSKTQTIAHGLSLSNPALGVSGRQHPEPLIGVTFNGAAKENDRLQLILSPSEAIILGNRLAQLGEEYRKAREAGYSTSLPQTVVESDDGHPMLANKPTDGSEPTASDVTDDNPSPYRVLLELLKEVEWSATNFFPDRPGEPVSACPWCGGGYPGDGGPGHSEGCKMKRMVMDEGHRMEVVNPAKKESREEQEKRWAGGHYRPE